MGLGEAAIIRYYRGMTKTTALPSHSTKDDIALALRRSQAGDTITINTASHHSYAKNAAADLADKATKAANSIGLTVRIRKLAGRIEVTR